MYEDVIDPMKDWKVTKEFNVVTRNVYKNDEENWRNQLDDELSNVRLNEKGKVIVHESITFFFYTLSFYTLFMRFKTTS